MLPDPHFRDDWSTIYNADCRTILPHLPAGAVVITDQPYGTGWVRGGGKAGEFKPRHEKPVWDVWDLAWLDTVHKAKRIAAFSPRGNVGDLSRRMKRPAVLRYLKTNTRPGGADYEPIVCDPPPDREGWEFSAYNGDMPLHPCQKPLELMVWLVELVSDPGDLIVDCFMGSGTTLVAAKLCNRKAIGIEIDPTYCATAVERLAQGVLTL
jgi:DNA modification methylase